MKHRSITKTTTINLVKNKKPMLIDGSLDINMEELNESTDVIHEPMIIIPGEHTYCLPNNATPCYAYQDKSNLVKALVSKISSWKINS